MKIFFIKNGKEKLHLIVEDTESDRNSIRDQIFTYL